MRQQRPLDHARHILIAAPASSIVATADVMVEHRGGGHVTDGHDVLVAPIARRREHADTATLHVEPIRKLAELLDGIGVVSVVEQHAELMLIIDIQATRRLEEARVEGPQAMPDVLEAHAHRERHCRSEHRVLHVVQRLALDRRRDQVCPEQRNVRAMIVDRDHGAVDAVLQRDGAAAGADVLAHQLMIGVERDVADMLCLGVRGHAQRERIVGIEHRGVPCDLDDGALDLGQLLECVDALLAQVIRAHVEHCTDIHVARGHAGAQQPAACRLEHRNFHVRVAEHDARGRRAGHVADDRTLSVHVHAIGGRETHALAGELVDVRKHARGRGLAVRAGDRCNGNRARRAGGEEHVDGLAGDVTRTSIAGRHVHAEARRCVHFADRATDFLVTLRDVGCEKVHATDVEPDRLDRAHCHLGVVGMHEIRHVTRGAAGAQVGGEAQVHDFIKRRHRRRGVAEFLEQPVRLRIQLDARQHLFVPDAATWIGVHDRHQFLNAVRAVTDHVTRLALADGDEFTVDHHHAMIVAGDERLDDHAAGVFLCARERLADFGGRHQVDGDAAAVIAVVRLQHDGVADATCRVDRHVDGLHETLPRNRQAEIREDLVRLLLVGRQLDGDVRRAPRDGGLDALLIAAISQLDQRLLVEADPRDTALLGRVHDGCGAGAECTTLRVADEVVAPRVPVKAAVELVGLQVGGEQRVEQRQRE